MPHLLVSKYPIEKGKETRAKKDPAYPTTIG